MSSPIGIEDGPQGTIFQDVAVARDVTTRRSTSFFESRTTRLPPQQVLWTPS